MRDAEITKGSNTARGDHSLAEKGAAMTEQQQREACAQLARRMGITIEKRWQHVTDSSWCLYDLRLPGGTYLGAHCGSIEEAHALLPDYFNSPVASRELVIWLAKQEVIVKRRFVANLHPGLSDACVFNDAPIDEDMILEAMVAEPSVIARAACKALGIEVSE